MFRLSTLMALAVLATACPALLPDPSQMNFACHGNESCPNGFYCDPNDSLCRAVVSDAGPPDQVLVADAVFHDTGGSDSADAGLADSYIEPDSALSDSLIPDMAVADTASPDIFAPDTFVSDAAVPDSFVPDTVSPDSFIETDSALPDSTVFTDASLPDTSAPDIIPADTAGCVPTGPEIAYLGADNCADGEDNDCDGLTDDESWDCQDRDSDGIPNAVDVINVLDLDQVTGPETVCVPAHLVHASPWSQNAAYRQGTPAGFGGGLATLADSSVDPLTPIPGAPALQEWCFDFTGQNAGNYLYRYVSTLGVNGADPVSQTDCLDWVRPVMDNFCTYYSDLFCRRIFASDGLNNSCNPILQIIGVHWEANTLTPM